MVYNILWYDTGDSRVNNNTFTVSDLKEFQHTCVTQQYTYACNSIYGDYKAKRMMGCYGIPLPGSNTV